MRPHTDLQRFTTVPLDLSLSMKTTLRTGINCFFLIYQATQARLSLCMGDSKVRVTIQATIYLL